MSLSTLLQRDKIELTPAQIGQLERFCALLLAWRKTHNITGVCDTTQCHNYILDSLLPLSWLDPYASLLDIGSGGGFPGLLLAIARPDAQTVLVEPIAKKAAFLTYAALELGLANLKVEATHVEALAPRPFDLITSRAVAKTVLMEQLAAPFMGSDTTILLYKGSSVADEIDSNARVIARGERNYLILGKIPAKA